MIDGNPVSYTPGLTADDKRQLEQQIAALKADGSSTGDSAARRAEQAVTDTGEPGERSRRSYTSTSSDSDSRVDTKMSDVWLAQTAPPPGITTTPGINLWLAH